MAYALKTTGLATRLISLVVVDEDGTTVVDLKGYAVTKHASAGIGAKNWKGVSRKYIDIGGVDYTPYGVTWSSPPSCTMTDSDGMAVFMAFAGAGSRFQAGTFLTISNNPDNQGLQSSGSGKAAMVQGSATNNIGSTTLPVDGSTSFSIGTNWRNNANCQHFYGLESGAMAADSTAANPGNWGIAAAALRNIGGSSGQGRQPCKPHVSAVFDRELTLEEMQSLHNDWFGVLIDAGSPTVTLSPKPTTVAVGGTRTETATRSTAAPSGGVTYNLSSDTPAVATVPATAVMTEGQTTKTFDITGVSIGDAVITATNAADSGETDSVTVTVTAATVTTLQLLAHVDAVGATSVK
ncbi:MAG: hypothetical protein J0H00_19830, partial [Burkholderiales bacterium]|nr:hypothetical protein [Burkholderiales bacterium]